MPGNAMGPGQQIGEPLRLGLAVLFDVFPALGPPADGTHRKDETSHQAMVAVRCLGTTGISQRGKMLLKRDRRTHTHREFSSNAKDCGREKMRLLYRKTLSISKCAYPEVSLPYASTTPSAAKKSHKEILTKKIYRQP